MGDILNNIDFDQLSFWIGFLAGLLVWLMVRVLTPSFRHLQNATRMQVKVRRGEHRHASEIRLLNDMMRLAQSWHLAMAMFSLDEILIEPRLLAPPIPPDTDSSIVDTDITDLAIPYMPDWPEIGSFYGAPTLSLAEALQRDANIAVIGEPGIGKTVVLAHFATQLIRGEVSLPGIENAIPLLIHAADLIFQETDSAFTEDELLEPLRKALAFHCSTKTSSLLHKLLPNLLEHKSGVLLLDDLDEMPPDLVIQTARYLGRLIEAYPGIRLVATASPQCLNGLLQLEFFPLTVACWRSEQRLKFLGQWNELWNSYIEEHQNSRLGTVDSMLLTGWLYNNTLNLTPLELTLKVWAAYAGDALGPQARESIEAHIRRLTTNQSTKNRQALEKLAMQMMLSRQPVADIKSVERWAPDSSPAPNSATQSIRQAAPARGTYPPGRIKVSGALPGLIDSGLVILRVGERVSMLHPAFTGYLAAQGIEMTRAGEQMAEQPDWSGRRVFLRYLTIENANPTYLDKFLKNETSDPLQIGALTAGSWLRDAPEMLPWTTTVMRHLAGILQKENLPLGLKARALSALVQSGNQGLDILLNQMLRNPRRDLQQLAALGLGYLRQEKAFEDLSRLVNQKSKGSLQAAMLALVAVDSKHCLDFVAEALLHGEEVVRRAAAEALANSPEEGHLILEEAASMNDPLIRRAAVYGLMRINQPWSIRIVNKLRNEDPQWIVHDVATQKMVEYENPDLRTPRRMPTLAMSPWLIQFAGERGMGVSPGKPAIDLVIRTLREGNEKQRQSAIHYLTYHVHHEARLPLYQTLFATRDELQEAALNALWHNSAAGVTTPSPILGG